MPEENVLTTGLVSAKIAENHGWCATYGAQVTLEARLPRIALSTLRTCKGGFAYVFSKILGLLRGRIESYKLDARVLEWSKATFAREEFLCSPIKVGETRGEHREIQRRYHEHVNAKLNSLRYEISEIKNKIFILQSLSKLI